MRNTLCCIAQLFAREIVTVVPVLISDIRFNNCLKDEAKHCQDFAVLCTTIVCNDVHMFTCMQAILKAWIMWFL